MPHYVLPFFSCEGQDDVDFLLPVVQRTFEEVAAECAVDVVVYEQDPDAVLRYEGNGLSFAESVQQAALAAEAYGDSRAVLCMHRDADAKKDNERRTQVAAAFAAVTQEAALGSSVAFAAVPDTDPPVCYKLVAVMPVYEMEAWVMADKDALVAVMQTKLPLPVLGLDHAPESYGDPKQTLTDALAVARKHGAPRMTRTDLYEQLGQSLTPTQLAALPSYRKFREAVRDAFRQLGYLG